MMTRFQSLFSFLARRTALLALAGVCLAPLLVAGGGPNNSGATDPQADSSSPGDDVTGLPFTGPSGTTFVGSPRALRATILGVEGSGGLLVQRLSPGIVAATAYGNVQVRLDRARLASGEVLVVYRGGVDEGGMLKLLDQAPTPVETERLPLPLPRLAASTVDGQWLTLQAFAEASVTHVSVAARQNSVVLTQFVRQ
jgi:hypothetical protein